MARELFSVSFGGGTGGSSRLGREGLVTQYVKPPVTIATAAALATWAVVLFAVSNVRISLPALVLEDMAAVPRLRKCGNGLGR